MVPPLSLRVLEHGVLVDELLLCGKRVEFVRVDDANWVPTALFVLLRLELVETVEPDLQWRFAPTSIDFEPIPVQIDHVHPRTHGALANELDLVLQLCDFPVRDHGQNLRASVSAQTRRRASAAPLLL